ncbi:LytR/AlgR family response regulator transcription factor [Salinimicrobium sediminilitoris]|uniref:LytR/AlgR family response regulator transcription factor n=1 Tax=Salinimicrobium sediminilitoris TaxID=2876715 RepID=UPI001E4FE0BB|nr:LytTR family DNA-binding domain-containing protein [Salinimicrobium sediminilitoris]MCC8360209.1 LytTR family DNA-binding domain-containing protein [Salinimicrobium sediminilitoris]
MIRAVIVDDEVSAVKSLQWEINAFCPWIEVCATYLTPLEALKGIDLIKPDCVFLDIEMPQMDGFQLLHSLKFRNFELIFTTAYDNYALQAFKENAVDYLLKPIDSDDLKIAAERVLDRKKNNRLGEQLRNIMQDMRKQPASKKIPLSFVDKTIYVSSEDIMYCKSDGNYTEVYMEGGKKEVLSKKIKEVEALIDNPSFYRSHHSFLVNLDCVSEFIKSDGQYLILRDGSNIPVSRSKKAHLLELLGT